MDQVLTQHLQRLGQTSQPPGTSYRRVGINNWGDFNEFYERLKSSKRFAYDTETNGTFDRDRIGLVGLSFALDENIGYYIPLLHQGEFDQLDIIKVLARLKLVFENDEIEKICHNAKFDEMVLSRYGIDVKGFGHDTYIMAWLLAEDSGSRGLKQLILRIFGYEMETYEDVVSSAPKKKGIPRDYNFARVGYEEALEYAADDAYWTYKLFEYFKEKLEEQNLWLPYHKIEGPFVRVLRKIEAHGIFIDKPYIDMADEKLPQIAEQVETAIYEAAGEVFNIGSGKQLGTILFEKLGIGKNVPKTSSGNYATDKKTLSNYASQHQIVANVLRRKKIAKTHSVFVDGLKGFIGRDGRIHPSFNGSGTVTGRLSCSNPNLQQVEGDEVEEIKIRNFFIPEPGNVLVVGDYGQVELRIMAHFSKDQNMINAFLSGRDFHDETARLMFKLGPDDEVIHRQRFGAKAINFGIGYGRGPMSIAEQIGCTMVEAKALIQSWQNTYPGVIAYKNHVLSQARQHGYIRTLSGRKRRLPDILSNDGGLRSRAERQAFNTKIQGSAADIIKIAMIALQPKLVQYDAAIAIQIHDELVLECPEEHGDTVKDLMADVMANPLNGKNPLILPLVVDPKIVTRWGDGK